MKLGFYHDSPIKYIENENEYYSNVIGYDVLQRYLTVFDYVSVTTRVNKYQDIKKIKNSGNYVKSSGEGVVFNPVYSYNNIKSLIKLPKIIKEINMSIENNDAYLLRLPSIIGFITGIILIIKKKKYAVENVGRAKDAFYYRGDIISKILSGPLEFLQKIITNKANTTIYITESYLQNHYPTKGLGFDTVSNVNFDFSEKNMVNRHVNLGDATDQVKIGLVGSLNVKYKGHHLAILALKILKNKGYKNIKLEFVGGGSKESITKINDYAKKNNVLEHIEILGIKKSGDEIHKWMSNLNIYIQPSMTEGHGRALVEAVYNGCLCLGSNVGGIPDTLSDSYLFESGDYNELAKLIEKLIQDSAFRQSNLEENYNNIKKYDTELIKKLRNSALESYKENVDEVIT